MSRQIKRASMDRNILLALCIVSLGLGSPCVYGNNERARRETGGGSHDARVVVGTDDRNIVSDTSELPFSAIGRLEFRFSIFQSKTASCTGKDNGVSNNEKKEKKKHSAPCLEHKYVYISAASLIHANNMVGAGENGQAR